MHYLPSPVYFRATQPWRLSQTLEEYLEETHGTVHQSATLRACEAPDHEVFVFAAPPEDILNFAKIERLGRADDGQLKGSQRHKIASHIRESRDDLSRDHAILPSAVIVAFKFSSWP